MQNAMGERLKTKAGPVPLQGKHLTPRKSLVWNADSADSGGDDSWMDYTDWIE